MTLWKENKSFPFLWKQNPVFPPDCPVVICCTSLSPPSKIAAFARSSTVFTCKSSSLWESLWNLWNEETPSKKEAKTGRLLRPSPGHSAIPHSPNCTVASGSLGGLCYITWGRLGEGPSFTWIRGSLHSCWEKTFQCSCYRLTHTPVNSPSPMLYK